MAYLDRDDDDQAGDRRTRKMTPIGWIIVLVVAAGAGVLGRSVARELMGGFSGGESSITTHLSRASEELNRRVPVRLDDATTLERTEVLGQTLVYHYRVDGPTIMDTDAFAAAMAPALQRQACGDAALRRAMDEGARLRFIYRDSTGVLLNRTISNC